MIPDETEAILAAYHRWYYATNVWDQTTFLGVLCMKAVTDLWSYQEIISQLAPSIIVEFGTYIGGSALYFATIATNVNARARVLTVDHKTARIHESVKRHPAIEILEFCTTDPAVGSRISKMRLENPGPL